MRNTNGEVYVPSRLLKKAKSPLRHRVTESQRREGFRTYQKCQQILTLFVLIFLCVSVSLWLRLVFHQPARGGLAALPQHSAVRLCLTVVTTKNNFEATPPSGG